MATITLTAPSAWAPYMINCVPSDDAPAINAWLAAEGLGWPLDCRDAGFLWRHDASAFCPYGADCQEYVFLVAE